MPLEVARKRVLLDECLPHDFRHQLQDFDVQTAAFAGVAGLSNGELIAAIDGRFDVLVTVDGSLPDQQQVVGRNLAVVVLRAPTNRIADLLPLAAELKRAIEVMAPGEVRYVPDP